MNGRPLTIGRLLESIRTSDDFSQASFATTLKISRSHLNDIEKGNKRVSIERAARFAKALGFPPISFVELTIQSELDDAGLKYRVALHA